MNFMNVFPVIIYLDNNISNDILFAFKLKS